MKRTPIAAAARGALPLALLLASALLAAPASAQDGATTQPPAAPNPGADDMFNRAQAIDTGATERGKITSSRVLSLEDAVALVIENNRDIKIAEQRLQQAQILQDRAWALILPTATLSGVYTRFNKEISTTFGPTEIIIQPINAFNFQGSLQTSLFNGRAFPLLKAAYLAEDLQRLGNQQLALELRYATAQQYFQLLTLKKLILISEESLKAREVVLEATRARVNAGTATPFDATRAQTAVLTARNELEGNKLAFNKAREALASLLFTPADFDVADPRTRQLPASRSAFVDRAIQDRADLKLARKQMESNDLQQDANWWLYAPTLTAQFNVTKVPETAFQPNPWQWNLQLIAAWTLYDGGMREATIKEQSITIQTAQYELEKLENDLRRDVELAFLDVENLQIQIASAEEQVKLAETALNQAQDGYRLGALLQIDVLDAETQLRLAKASLARLQLAYDLAVESTWRVAGVDVLEKQP
jgi:multidrug efflux system outer membrane protein